MPLGRYLCVFIIWAVRVRVVWTNRGTTGCALLGAFQNGAPIAASRLPSRTPTSQDALCLVSQLFPIFRKLVALTFLPVE